MEGVIIVILCVMVSHKLYLIIISFFPVKKILDTVLMVQLNYINQNAYLINLNHET